MISLRKNKTKVESHFDIQDATPKEQVFKTWHRILLGYVICNLLFIFSSVFIINWITDRTSESTASTPVAIFDEEVLESAIQLNRLKTLVSDGQLDLPALKPLD